MKKLSSALFMAALTLFSLFSTSEVHAAGGDIKVELGKSSIEWLGKKSITGSKHYGVISLSSADLEMDGTEIIGGNFTIDMNSMKCTDLGEKMAPKLEGHLKSEDFFNVAEFPEATFVIKSVKKSPSAATSHEVTGTLTIKGITHPISFPMAVSVDDKMFQATADFTIDRTKWNIKYGSASFFDTLGDKAISDDIEFKVKLVATK